MPVWVPACLIVHLSEVTFDKGDLPLLHLKTIGISPELTLWVDAIEEFPVDSHVLTLEVIHWYGIQFNIKFNDFLEEGRETYFHDCILFHFWVLVNDSCLLHEVTLLIGDVLHEFTINVWQLVVPLG